MRELSGLLVGILVGISKIQNGSQYQDVGQENMLYTTDFSVDFIIEQWFYKKRDVSKVRQKLSNRKTKMGVFSKSTGGRKI